MQLSRVITVVGAHAEGEPNEVITGGVLDVPGATVFEKMRWLAVEGDALRRFLLNEPRGKVSQCVNLVVPSPLGADAGFVIMEADSYPAMSGTNTLCTATVLLETGMVPMHEPETSLVLEAPGGLIRVTARCNAGKVESITFRNLPSFVFALDRTIEVPGLGSVSIDVAYGGMIYAIVDAAMLGFAIAPDEAADLARVGETIKAAAAEQVPAVHPDNPEIHTINQVQFVGPLRRENGTLSARNGVIVSPGRLDRSPCGTGTAARLAVMRRRGLVEPGEAFIHESILSTRFTGRIVKEGVNALGATVTTEITGRAWITALHQYVLDPADPFPEGYRLSDTWPALVGVTRKPEHEMP